MTHRITIICDNCGQEYLMEQEMELPPYWMAVPISIANGEGMINGREHFIHICSLECLADYATGDQMKEQLMTVDKPDEDGPFLLGEDD